MTEVRDRVAVADASDELLADRAADGDSRSFGELVRRYTPNLRAYVRRILGSDAEVDDVLQVTFVAAWQQLRGLDDRAAVKGWLFRIAHRKAIDAIRARKEHADIADHERPAPPSEGPAERGERSSRRQALDIALAGLPEDQRRCWLLREIGDLSYAEIAEELDLPASTVRGLLSRARARIVTEMEAWR